MELIQGSFSKKPGCAYLLYYRPTLGGSDKAFMERAHSLLRGTEVTVLGLSTAPSKASFNTRRFFDKLHSVCRDGSFSYTSVSIGPEQLDHLTEEIERESQALSRQKYMELKLLDNTVIGASLITLCKDEKPPAPMKLDATTHEQLRIDNSNKMQNAMQANSDVNIGEDQQENQPFHQSSSIVYEYTMGNLENGETVHLTSDHLDQIKSITDEGIKVIGFKPREELQDYQQIRESTFLFPSNKEVANSTYAFAALHEAMQRKNCIAIANFCRYRKAPVQQVALLPQEEEIREDDGVRQKYSLSSYSSKLLSCQQKHAHPFCIFVQAQLMPPGMHIIFLPYRNDFRDVKTEVVRKAEHQKEEIDDQAVTAAKELLQSLDLGMEQYDPAEFPNPRLERHHRIIEDIGSSGIITAGEVEPKDTTVPDNDFMERMKCNELARTFLENAYNIGEPYEGPKSLQSKSQGRKRSSTQASLECESTLEGARLQELATSGGLEELTVPEIKQALGERGLHCPLLCQRIEMYSFPFLLHYL